MTEDTLAQTCTQTADAALDALDWFANPENEDLVGTVRPQLQREFRRFSTQARALSEAVSRPMCVGLFGPSQAGKSYLAAGLSRNGSKPLHVRFAGGEDKNFLNQINPEGDRESTGVVTRFSMKDVPHPDGFPVALRLLSESDVIKILGNTYFLDSDPKVLSPIPAEELAKVLQDSRAGVGTSDGTFSVERVWDLQDYFQKQFGHLTPMTALSDFWEEAEDLAPKLDITGRAKLFSALWGLHGKLTETYLALVTALAQLGFPTDAFAGIDALIPRAKSIIDVETLLGLGDPNAETLAVRTFQGAAISLARPVVTALIAELRLVIAEQPWPMFEHTDLLDFPGARNRDPLDLTDFLQKDDALKQLLVRGKVAYLFDRYVADQELTSMLLCVKPSNQDITSLPSLVSDWIDRTHGSTPEQRSNRPTLLFFILGWFNEHLKRLPGEDEDDLGTRYKSRINGALPDFFGKSQKKLNWTNNWTTGQPFQNCFWLRDPGFSTQTFEAADGQETGVKPEEQDRIARMRQAYLDVEEVQTYFADPAEAWDKAMLPADGGVKHLAMSLEPVCEPDMKRRQVAGRLQDLRQQMRAKLVHFYVSDDAEKRIAERRVVADDVLRSVEAAANARQFGALLKILQIDEGFLRDHLYKYRNRAAQAATPPQDEGSQARRRGRFDRGNAAAQPVEVTRSSDAKDKTVLICDEMVRTWISLIGERADSERIARDLRVPADHLKEIVSELAGAAQRLGLSESIAQELRRFAFHDGADRAIIRNAVVGARQINGFVAKLGFDKIPEANRPTAPTSDGQQCPVFKAEPFVSSSITLPETPVLPEDAYLEDWGFAFMQFVDDNASSSEGQTINREQNRALGQILSLVDADTDEGV